MNWDYIAGFFDGEGYLVIYRKERRHGYGKSIRFHISQKDTKILEEIKDFLIKNGVQRIYIRKDSNGRASFIQVSNVRDVKIILENIKDKVHLEKNVKRVNEALDYINNTIWRLQIFYPEEKIKEVLSLWDNGIKSRKEIAEKVRISPITVAYWIKRFRNDSYFEYKRRILKEIADKNKDKVLRRKDILKLFNIKGLSRYTPLRKLGLIEHIGFGEWKIIS